MLICAGCSFGELEYDMNLGYDLNKVKSKDITFNVYHVNPEDHSHYIQCISCKPGRPFVGADRKFSMHSGARAL